MIYEFVSRSVWGSSTTTEKFIADRYSATKDEKTALIVHHTAAIDTNDSTPNKWDRVEAYTYMRRLQTVRPELGPLPYSMNMAILEDGSILLLEGRGLLKVGAHTAGMNRSGIGVGVFGNFDKAVGAGSLGNLLKALSFFAGDLRHNQGFTRLGDAKNPNGWEAWGHKDTKQTACPGSNLYARLNEIAFVATPPMEENVDMMYVNKNPDHMFGYKGFDHIPSRWRVEYWQNIFKRIDPSLTFDKGQFDDAFVAAMKKFGGSTVGIGPTEEDRILRRLAEVTSVGAPGPKGDKGDPGPAGPAGPKGADGTLTIRGAVTLP